jgi:hypothetical protein
LTDGFQDCDGSERSDGHCNFVIDVKIDQDIWYNDASVKADGGSLSSMNSVPMDPVPAVQVVADASAIASADIDASTSKLLFHRFPLL